MKGTVGELGEFGLIRELTSRLTTTPAVRVGPGDDAAVVAAPDRRVVASTDILLEGRHFRRDWSTAYDVGRKAAAQNLADIAAMGAVPTALLLGLVVPAELPVTWASELMDGLRDECQVVGLLYRGRCEERESRLAHGHHVRMVTEDRQSLGCQRSGCHVDDRRGQFAGDLVHVRDHQQQALRRGEGRGQCTALQGPVQSARRATLALHFDHGRDGAPHIGALRA